MATHRRNTDVNVPFSPRFRAFSVGKTAVSSVFRRFSVHCVATPSKIKGPRTPLVTNATKNATWRHARSIQSRSRKYQGYFCYFIKPVDQRGNLQNTIEVVLHKDLPGGFAKTNLCGTSDSCYFILLALDSQLGATFQKRLSRNLWREVVLPFDEKFRCVKAKSSHACKQEVCTKEGI